MEFKYKLIEDTEQKLIDLTDRINILKEEKKEVKKILRRLRPRNKGYRSQHFQDPIPVKIDNQPYTSLSQAGRVYGITRYSVYKRCASDEWPTWTML